MAELTEYFQIDNYNDTFALGHYARVFDAVDRRSGKPVAFKVMRPEHLTDDGELRWEFRAFANEAEILMRLESSPNIIRLLDCGYLASGDEAPNDGEIVSFQLDIRGFASAMVEYGERGWRPYLSLENLPRINNLFYLMKPNQPGVRWRLPSEEGLALAVQFSNVLKFAHTENIVYLDHKLEHVYWDGAQLRIIDFNSSSQLNNGGTNESEFRKDIHNLCVGVLYPLFTGMSPQKTTLRPQPSSKAEVEARYTDISELDFGMEPTLSPALQDLLQAGAAMQLETVDDFVAGLHEVAALHGWDFPQHYTSPASRDARDQMRAGLKRLREGQEHVRVARDLFREAIILDGITEDLEDELRRLVKSVNDMLNERVIP